MTPAAMMAALAAVAAVALLALAAAWRLHRRAPPPDALLLLQRQMDAGARQTALQMEHLRTALQQINGQISQTLAASRQAMDERLDGATRVIHGLHQQLGRLDEASRRIFDIGKDISRLQETLSAPKLRGNMGELFLDELLSQLLPADHFQMQYAFRDGATVDAVILLKAGLVPVDAKFPLENFRRLHAAGMNTAERQAARRLFARDLRTHIESIAAKYIRPAEGTFDFALMYIPAENVYYETILREDENRRDTALFPFALGRRVIPVSPNSFYVYLQTILLGLKGLRVEEGARELLNQIAQLQQEFERFGDAFRLVGQHLENSGKKYAEAEKRLGRMAGQIEDLSGTTGAVAVNAAAPGPPAPP